MSKNKGFSDTSANRYSLALFELASETNLLDQVEKNSTSILNLISNNKDFKNFIKDGKDLKIITVGSKGHDQIKADFGKYIIDKKSFKEKKKIKSDSRVTR